MQKIAQLGMMINSMILIWEIMDDTAANDYIGSIALSEKQSFTYLKFIFIQNWIAPDKC